MRNRHTKKALRIFTASAATLIFTAATPAIAQPQSKQVWTIKQILAERQPDHEGEAQRLCQGGLFKPCVCARDVSKSVQYRPAVKECGGKAAIILSGRYLDVFSVVVRDNQNKDRWPVQGINGCTAEERDTLGLNKCSAFKVQKSIGVSDRSGDAEIHCLGASGYSSLFRNVTRITAKLQDLPSSTSDPLERLCLAAPDKPLN